MRLLQQTVEQWAQSRPRRHGSEKGLPVSVHPLGPPESNAAFAQSPKTLRANHLSRHEN
jgi:hypothetical protein